jgi:hypothetical protein
MLRLLLVFVVLCGANLAFFAVVAAEAPALRPGSPWLLELPPAPPAWASGDRFDCAAALLSYVKTSLKNMPLVACPGGCRPFHRDADARPGFMPLVARPLFMPLILWLPAFACTPKCAASPARLATSWLTVFRG